MEFINALSSFVPLFTVIIALMSFFAGLGFMFNNLLSPVKGDLTQLKDNQIQLKNRMDIMEKNQSQIKDRMDIMEGLSGYHFFNNRQAIF